MIKYICCKIKKNEILPIGMIFLLLVLFPAYVFSNEISLSVSGNTRTKTSYIENIVRDYLRRMEVACIDEIDPEQLKDAIFNKELFSEVNVEIRDDHIYIKVKDRWTLIPIPMIITETDQDTKYGLFVMEKNFLGYGKCLMLGSVMSTSEASYFLRYHDPEFHFSDWIFTTQIISIQKTTYLYSGDEKIYGDDRNSSLSDISIGYAFSKTLEASIAFGTEQYTYEALDDYETPRDYNAVKGSLQLEWDSTNYRFYYRDGLKAQVDMTQQFVRSDDAENTFDMLLMVSWQTDLIARQVCQIQFQAGYMDKGDQRSLFRAGGDKGLRGVPDAGAWVDELAAASIDYQIPLWQGKLGTWTVAPFMDTGYLHQPSFGEENITYTSYGIGTYLYLKEIAIPGIGLHIGHNDTYQGSFCKATIGFSF